MRAHLVLVGAFITLAVAAGCGGTGVFGSQAERMERDSVLIVVDNRNFADAVISVQFSGGPRQRLGTVRSREREIYMYPWISPEARFFIDLIGGDEFFTRPIRVTQDGSIRVVLPFQFSQSPEFFRGRG